MVESWENIYDNFIPLSSIQSETSAYNTYKIELFVVASRDANILLSSNDIVNVTTDDVYQIGEHSHSHSRFDSMPCIRNT